MSEGSASDKLSSRAILRFISGRSFEKLVLSVSSKRTGSITKDKKMKILINSRSYLITLGEGL